MDNSLEKIIRKYLDGSATPEEIRRVEDYYRSYSAEEDYTKKLPPNEKQALEDRILLNISQRLSGRTKVGGSQRHLVAPRYLLKAAAVLAGILFVSFLYLTVLSDSTTRIATAYGEMKEHILPDNSVVVLNGNSAIEYGPWKEDQPRTVSLRGEAYFSVTHTKDHRKFLVKIPGAFEVEVLGTEFNVTARKSNTSVVLNSGAVRINGLSSDSAITLKPGERIVLGASGQKVVKTVVDAERYASWRNQKLIFDNTPLSQIITMLEETYGYRVTIEDETLLQETFTGTIPHNDIDILLLGLNKIGLEVTTDGREIRIRK